MDIGFPYQDSDWTQYRFIFPGYNETHDNGLWATDIHESSYGGVCEIGGSSDTTSGLFVNSSLVPERYSVTGKERNHVIQDSRPHGHDSQVLDHTQTEKSYYGMTLDNSLAFGQLGWKTSGVAMMPMISNDGYQGSKVEKNGTCCMMTVPLQDVDGS
jgi:hypothetical protein